jgi:hypothetical protein
VPGLPANFTRPFVAQPGLTFSSIENLLISRFNLWRAPQSRSLVSPVFLRNAQFTLRAEPAPEAPGSADRRWTADRLRRDADRVCCGESGFKRLLDFGDQTDANSTVATHVYQTPGLYRVKLFSPSIVPHSRTGPTLSSYPAPATRRQAVRFEREPLGLDPSPHRQLTLLMFFNRSSPAAGFSRLTRSAPIRQAGRIVI